MRTPLTLTALLAISLAAQSQTVTFLINHPSRQAFVECAEALPRLYEQRDFDSIGLLLRRRLRNNPGFQTDIFALRILLEIQQHRFIPDSLTDANLYFGLDNYVHDAEASQSEMGFNGIYSFGEFDARPYYEEEFSMFAVWAENLIETRRLGNAESFLCQVFAGDFEHPRKTARGDKVRYWQMNSMLDASFWNRRKISTFSLFAGGGVWIPQGKLRVLGVHPSITAIGLGVKNRFSELDFVLALRFAQTAHPYTVLRGDSVYSLNHFFGGYVGIDYTRWILHTTHFETGALFGAGYDGFDVNDNDNNSTSSPVGPPPPTSINSLNLNLGWRLNYYFNPTHYIGLAGRYNFVQYSNPGGTPLNGNAVTIDLIVGFN